MAPLDELQRLAGDRIRPALLGGQGEDVGRGLLQNLARDGEPLQDLAAGVGVRPPEHDVGVVRAQLGPAQQQRDELRILAAGRHHELDGGVGQLGQIVAQQGLDHRRLHRLDEDLGDHLPQAPAHGDQPAMLGTGVAAAIEQVGVRQGRAVLQQGLGDLELVAQQHAHQAGRDLGQGRQPARHPQAFLDGRLAQHVHQQVRGHAPFEGVDPAGRQADHVGQAFEQGDPRLRRRWAVGRRRNRLGQFKGLGAHGRSRQARSD